MGAKGRIFAWSAASIVALALAAVYLTPYAFAEFYMWARLHDRIGAPPPADPGAFEPRPGPPLGTEIAGWRVQQIAPDTYALGEPAGDLDNYEYLLVGRTRALLIDAGATPRDIRPVLATLTTLPVTVIPTHLHYDHSTGLRTADRIALVDLPETRGRAEGDLYHLSRYQYLQQTRQGGPFEFRVSEWVKPDAEIDLGGRKVRLLATPGHTSTSISIFDPAADLLFTGDLIYPTTLFAFVPSASLSAYVETFDRLLAEMPADVTIYGAHCCRNDVPAQAPWLKLSDIRDARDAILAVEHGKARGRGILIRRYPVNSRMTLLTLYPFGNW
jgi:glyoxylase-like metal-dependent hydrolase (beta-lactamase superfamily II)